MKVNQVKFLLFALFALPFAMSCKVYEAQPIVEPTINYADDVSTSDSSSDEILDSTSEEESEEDILDHISQWSIDIQNMLDSVGAIVGISGLTLASIIFMGIKLLIPNKKGYKKLDSKIDEQVLTLMKALNNEKESIAVLKEENKKEREFFLNALQVVAKTSRNVKVKTVVQDLENYINGESEK